MSAIVIPGTLRDSLYLLAVVLEQQTELNPMEIMTHTGAYTDVVFGLFWISGSGSVQGSPISEARDTGALIHLPIMAC